MCSRLTCAFLIYGRFCVQIPGAQRLHPEEEGRAGRRREAGAKECSQQGLLLNGLASIESVLANVSTALSMPPRPGLKVTSGLAGADLEEAGAWKASCSALQCTFCCHGDFKEFCAVCTRAQTVVHKIELVSLRAQAEKKKSRHTAAKVCSQHIISHMLCVSNPASIA